MLEQPETPFFNDFDPEHNKVALRPSTYKEGSTYVSNERAILFDPVKIPAHYNQGKIEVANFIADQELDYPSGNVVKYTVRAGKKNPDKTNEDIEKAAAYLQMKYNLANGLPAVVRDPVTKEVKWSLFEKLMNG